MNTNKILSVTDGQTFLLKPYNSIVKLLAAAIANKLGKTTTGQTL